MSLPRHGLTLGRSGLKAVSLARTNHSVSIASTSRLFSTTSRNMASSNTPAAPGEDLVTYDSSGHARIYRLNRPKKLNSLNHEMITSLAEKMKAWRESDLAKVVIGMGNERAFCAGGDVAQLVKDAKEKKDTGIAFFKDEFELNWLLSRLGKPYVSVIDGTTMGGGAGISLPANIRIATPRTIFAMPETGIGYAPDVGSNYYLAQLDGWIGAWLAVTGQHIYGRTIYELGIATHYVAESSIPDMIRQITHHSDPSSANISKIVSSFNLPPSTSSEPSSKKNPDAESPITTEIRLFLDNTFSAPSVKEIHDRLSAAVDQPDLSEGVRAWARVQKGYLEEKSPTGMAVALEGFRMAKEKRRLDKALENDMTMATAFCGPQRVSEDFIIGVTHVLIDKTRDRRASWESELSSSAVLPTGAEGVQRFFSSKIKAPTLNFHPSSGKSNSNEPDSTYGRFREWGLPSEYQVRGQITGEAPSSGSFKLKEEELVSRILRDKGEAEGSGRAEDVKRMVRDIVERYADKDKEGYLGWRWAKL